MLSLIITNILAHFKKYCHLKKLNWKVITYSCPLVEYFFLLRVCYPYKNGRFTAV